MGRTRRSEVRSRLFEMARAVPKKNPTPRGDKRGSRIDDAPVQAGDPRVVGQRGHSRRLNVRRPSTTRALQSVSRQSAAGPCSTRIFVAEVGCSGPLEQSSFPGCRSDPFVTVHPRSCIAATNDMTTIWRPHPLVKHIIPVEEEVPDDDVPDVKVEPVADDDGIHGEGGKKTDLEGKGAKRKRAPPTKYPKGPCEHGIKHRSKCKMCSGCPHGRQRSKCKECGGSGICEHGRVRSQCKECGGSQILSLIHI